jgi:uncharacterized protein YdeI (YjbR/CyaY-like superfamily)
MAVTEEILTFESQGAFAQWLDENHDRSDGVWVRHAKKGTTEPTVTHDEALEVALCFGWIDAIRKAYDSQFFIQRWTPRRARSIWSKINKERALRYIEQGIMQPSGLAEVERAQEDGRWDAAYDSVKEAQVPPDLQAAFDAHPGAEAFFKTVSSQNRYAVLFRIQTAKKAETRARRIAQFAEMLARGETIY